MAEVVAAAYAVETAVEGTAVAALAVSGSTVPLHAHFQKIPSKEDRPKIDDPLDGIFQYDGTNETYSAIDGNKEKCTEGMPEPRASPSSAKSPYPPPISALTGYGPSLDAHGTAFLHGGYNADGKALHDTWTFDLGTKAWHKFPTIVEDVLKDSTVSGQILYSESKLWYVNAATVMYLELAERDPNHSEPQSQNPDTLSTGRVGSGQWQVVYPPVEADPEANQEKQALIPANCPTEPTHRILPITTGAGRQYILSFPKTNPQNMHLFQIPSSPKTATSIKDTIRDRATSTFSSLAASWKSGKYEWSKVEVVQSSKQDGEIERPAEDLVGYKAGTWTDGDKIVIVGGNVQGGKSDEVWVVQFD